MPVLSRCAVAVVAAGALAGVAACSSSTHGAGSTGVAARLPLTSAASSTSSLPSTPTTSARTKPTPTTRTSSPTPTHAPPRSTSAASSNVVAQLPLPYPTGDATEVITATAPSMSSTSGTLQTWQRVTGGWTRVGPAVTAWFGSQGLTAHMSEFISATPVGSYTLTQAFGSQANPGTGLPYFRTTPADWWISKTTAPDNKLYNTHQHCSSDCPFDTSDSTANTNEHLYYSQPYYRYAVVIDYNTTNAPGGVVQQAGSAVFLHVTVHAPTAGCVAIDESRLVAIMQWLRPSAHPRILIGVA